METMHTIDSEAITFPSVEQLSEEVICEESSEKQSLYIAFLAGNRSAFNQLVTILTPKIFRRILFKVGNQHDAEDVLQEIWLKLSQDTSYDSHQKFDAWFSRIVRNAIIDFCRSRQKRKNKILSETDFFANNDQSDVPLSMEPYNHVAAIEQQEEVKDLLTRLPLMYRQTLTLIYFEGCSIKEVATIEGVTEHAIDQRIMYLKKTIRTRCVLMTH